MQLLRAEQVRPHPPHAMVCRASRLAAALTIVVMGAMVIGTWMWATHAESRFFQIAAIATGAFVLPLTAYNLAQTLKADNWLARVDDNGVVIRFRSWRRGPAPDGRPEAVALNWDDIVDIRPVREVIRERRGGQRTARWTRRSLEFRIRGNDLDALGLAVMEDATANRPRSRGIGIRVSSPHHPVRWIDDGVIAVTFHGKYDAVTPKRSRVIARIRAHATVLPERVVDAGRVKTMASEAFERHIVALVDGGDTLAAVQAVRERVGCSLTEARESVRGIADRGRSDCTDHAS